MVMILRRIVGLSNEKSGAFGPLSHQRSRLFLSPTGSWLTVALVQMSCNPDGASGPICVTAGLTLMMICRCASRTN